MSYDGWRPYVSAARRRARAAREMKKLRSEGIEVEPVEIPQGRKIARTFWGESWCKHLERFSDFANRLPRGRTYIRNGSVCHLAIKKGKVEAIVSGSGLYKVGVRIAPLPSKKWNNVRKQCAGHIGSILELLQGQLSSQVMEIVTDSANGLFPQPGDIKLHCDCPDWADMCKHVAAVLYGVGARLDEKPELLFVLRNVHHEELISTELDIHTATNRRGKRRRLANPDLSNVFGIDLEDATPPAKKSKTAPRISARRGGDGISTEENTTPGSREPRAGRVKTTSKRRTFTPTGASVTRLRKRYAMTRSQFADLLGVSPQTIAKWESKRGRLVLQKRTLEALTHAWSKK